MIRSVAMSVVWNTKYGRRRIKHEPPTLEEALEAARGLTENRQEQVEIAASLMDLPVEEVKAKARTLAPPRLSVGVRVAPRTGRQVLVERKAARRIMPREPARCS
jgi:hypothetical protein